MDERVIAAYEDYITWKSGNLWPRQFENIDIETGTIKRIGPASVVIVLKGMADVIVKIPTGMPRGLPLKDEYEMLKMLEKENFKGAGYIIPKALAYGKLLPYLAMERVKGDALPDNISQKELERTGTAIGRFAAMLFDKYKMIHDDIYNGNIIYNGPKEPIGIIDIASMEITNQPEQMFMEPILCDINLSPYIAREFERITGHLIDMDLFEEMHDERMKIRVEYCSPEMVNNLWQISERNIAEMRTVLEASREEADVTCTRPVREKFQRQAPAVPVVK